jgi:ubiquinone/menaquinone biosynthesis C-methylase UbiE
MSKEVIDVEHEKNFFHEMLGQVAGELWLDLAASTALYGRWLAPLMAPQGGEVISLDLASPMLRRAQQMASKEGLGHISFVVGRGEHLPFASNSLDGVVCGGSLNEFGPKGVLPVLHDVARALRPGGVGLFMHLLTAKSRLGSYAQRYLARPGGIGFWRREETDRLFEQAGFVIEERRDFGVVAFTRLRLV